MKIRRFAAVALAAAGALIPVSSHALPGDTVSRITGTDCTVGSTDLAFNEGVGRWEGVTALACASAKPQLSVRFVVTQVTGVDTTAHPYLKGPTAFGSYDQPNQIDTFYCVGVDCTGVQARGSRVTLAPGLYIVKSIAAVNTASGIQRNGYHVNCYLVLSDTADGSREVEGCVP